MLLGGESRKLWAGPSPVMGRSKRSRRGPPVHDSLTSNKRKWAVACSTRSQSGPIRARRGAPLWMKLGNAKKNVLPFCKFFRQKLCSKHFNDLTSKKKHVHFPITPRGLSRAGSRPCRLQLRIFESNFLLLFSYLITKPVDAHAAIGAKATQGDLSSITLSVEVPSHWRIQKRAPPRVN